MTRPAILDAFASHDFLRRLDDCCLMDLASGVRPFAVETGSFLAREGEPATAFYLIQFGTVGVGPEPISDDLFEPAQTVGPGGVLGWSWLVPPHRWQFSARAEEPVQGLKFDAEWLRERCERNHELGYQVLREMLVAMSAQLAASRREMKQPAEVV